MFCLSSDATKNQLNRLGGQDIARSTQIAIQRNLATKMAVALPLGRQRASEVMLNRNLVIYCQSSWWYFLVVVSKDKQTPKHSYFAAYLT